MTTVQNVIDRTWRDLYAGTRVERNKLSAAMTDTTTGSFTVTNPAGGLNGLQTGAKASIALEDMYVWSSSGSTVTCTRGDFGSTAATHLINSVVYVDAQFTPFEVFTAMNEVLDQLSAEGLYQIKTIDITYNSSINGYDLAGVGAVTDILDIRWKQFGSWKDWPLVPRSMWRYIRNQATTEFPSTQAILMYGVVGPGRTMHVRYQAPFSYATAVTDDILTVTGLPATAHDLLHLGAAIRLAESREIQRNFNEAQGSSRTAAEVPPGAMLTAVRGLQARYQARVNEEVGRLMSSDPPMIPVM